MIASSLVTVQVVEERWWGKEDRKARKKETQLIVVQRWCGSDG